MTMIFIDTSAFYALEVEDDINHEQARSFLNELRKGKYGALLTSDYVLDETLTLLRIRHGVEVALKFYDKVRRSRSLRIIWVDETIFNKALEPFSRNNKLKWSFTDCVSFAIMKLLDIKYAFTFDKNFEEAGFIKLP
ncbi:MAG: DNA-binding protein [Thermoprotei archaeon]|nr:MAG: DNA-binding protein [Thermoprotei archaeon]